MSRFKAFSLLIVGFSVLVLLIVGCTDLVSTSDVSACDTAMDDRDYTEALNQCTSRKDIASAYLGLAGFDVINLTKSSETTTTTYDDPGSGTASLGTDGNTGAQILGILQIDATLIPDATERTTKVTAAKENLDAAIGQLHPFLNDESDPLSGDEKLLDAFALSFAMVLQQTVSYDQATTSTSAAGTESGGYLTCPEVTESSNSSEVLQAYDGHLWTAEQNGIQCNRLATVVNAETDSLARATLILSIASVFASDTKTLLDVDSTGDVQSAVCEPTETIVVYLDKLTDVLAKLSTSGDSTSVLGDSSSATDTMLKALKCK